MEELWASVGGIGTGRHDNSLAAHVITTQPTSTGLGVVGICQWLFVFVVGAPDTAGMSFGTFAHAQIHRHDSGHVDELVEIQFFVAFGRLIETAQDLD